MTWEQYQLAGMKSRIVIRKIARRHISPRVWYHLSSWMMQMRIKDMAR